jgi:Protein of unknown function (DUF2793)
MPNTPKMAMPYIVTGQAQKEITHNDALNDLDSLAQITVLSRAVITPPLTPFEGDSYIIPSTATGAWAGNTNAIASYYSGWRIKVPKAGWQAYVQDESMMCLYDGTVWNATVASQAITLFGNITAPSWTNAGVAFKAAAATYTNTTSSGVVATQGVYSFGIPTLNASAATTYTNSGTVIIRGAPVSGTNVTQSNVAALLVESGGIRIVSGSLQLAGGSYTGGAVNAIAGSVNISGNQSIASWTTSGVLFRANAVTLTDTTGTGVIATRVANSFAALTFASTLAVTLTDAATFYVAGAPVSGTNTTITRGWSHYVAAGNAYFGGGVVMAATPAAPNANALLDIQSTTKAFMPPRMTTAQKTAIPSPTSGMVVYDSTLNKLCVFGASAWETITSV